MRKIKIICIVTAFVMIFTLLTGCGVLQKLGLQKSNNDELTPVSSIVMGEEEAKALSDKAPIFLYFANADNTKLTLEVRYVSQSETKKSTNSLATLIVKELINGPTAQGLKKTIPEGTKLLTSVDVKAGIATVNFSQEFIDKHTGGRTAEQLTLYSVANTLTELKDVEKVKFTINGKTQKDFKGNFQLDAPFPKNTALISKPTSATGAVSSEGSKETSKTDNKVIDTKSNTNTSTSKVTDTKNSGTSKPSSSTSTTKSTSTSTSTTKSGSTTTSKTTSSTEADEATYLESLELLE